MNDTPPRWALYARAADEGAVRAQLAELRAYVQGETEGGLHVECFDVGRPGPGRQMLLTLMHANMVDCVLVADLARLERRAGQLASPAEAFLDAATLKEVFAVSSAQLFALSEIRERGTRLPVELQEELRQVFTSAGVGPDELGERSPSWYHDGVLSLLRRQMCAAQAELGQAEADSPPGFGVRPEVMQARIAAARAERVFAERLVEVLQNS
ncbi:hypothetical protein [Streptosporangium sp. CA-115845]|uniref:hypothetical protein n=1 Tax=Streptosporangium sp. CA-115845 TaxID=3240071 RepID=UPI003D8B2B8B